MILYQNPDPHQISSSSSSSSSSAPSLSHPSALSHATPSEATTRNLGHAAGSNRQIHLYTTIPSSSSTWQWESPTIHLHPFVDDPAVRPIDFPWFTHFPKCFIDSSIPFGKKKLERTHGGGKKKNMKKSSTFLKHLGKSPARWGPPSSVCSFNPITPSHTTHKPKP